MYNKLKGRPILIRILIIKVINNFSFVSLILTILCTTYLFLKNTKVNQCIKNDIVSNVRSLSI